jgi:S1-C subfamily serine protease
MVPVLFLFLAAVAAAQQAGGDLRPIVEDGSGRTFTPEERTNIAVYEAVNRSVVNINTKATVPSGLFLLEVPSEGAGSGIVLDKQGHVLTNYHVVEGAREIQVLLFDGSSHGGKLVGFDPATDVAVLKVDAPADVLVPAVFGSSSNLRVGQRVFAIGNPFGLERTLTTGIISSLNRSLPTRTGRTIKSIIQTDAAINPGNSGGPLINASGEVIGINTLVRSGPGAGLGFAIPINLAKRVADQLASGGRVIHPYLGLQLVPLTARVARENNQDPNALLQLPERDGALVQKVLPQSPAEVSGLKRGDLVVSIAENRVVTPADLLKRVEQANVGDPLPLKVVRGQREIQISIRPAALPQQGQSPHRQSPG